MNDAKLREQLSRDEGRSLTAYQDTNGFWTIGVGHLLGAHPRMTVITDAECDALLNWDIDVAAEIVHRIFPEAGATHGESYEQFWTGAKERVRWRALVNMAFNRGEKHMRESATITPAITKALATNEWELVPAAIVTSPWAGQIGARAHRLAYMLRTGEDA